MRSLWVCVRAFGAVVPAFLLACSAYDSSLLTAHENITALDGGPGGAADGAPALGDAAADGGKLGTECSNSPEFPTCVRPHAETTCASGNCFVVKCLTPYVDCDGQADNGCEARIDSADNCGLCGAACNFAHGSAACLRGQCVLADCESGYGDCDQDPANGCETALDDIMSCGSCTTKCKAAPHAIAGCIAGKCGIGACVGAFGDCNQDPKDGCEVALDQTSHCKSCRGMCTPANGAGSCASGDCVIDSCSGSFVDCNGLVGDGCEATLDSTAHCGNCSTKCALANTARQTCDTSQPTAACAVNHACFPDDKNCHGGALENGCQPGFGDCDADPKNGCETDLTRLKDCGSCGNSCVLANTVTACVAGACQLVGCVAGYDQCTSGAPCSSLASDPGHCGSCTKSCSGTKANCAGGACTDQACAPGTADCDGQGGNGCEVSLSSAGNCGVCGNACGPFAHATPACMAGACALGSCDAGYADCDGDVSNGCEVNILSTSDCGRCGKSCSFPNGQPSCPSGSCVLSSCDPGRADCNHDVTDGCETDLKLPDNCAACGNDCRSIPNVLSSGCSQGKCQYVCNAGRADCNKNAADGCEANLSSTTNCGACGNDCSSLPHVASASCGGSACKNLVCQSGWGDCNGDPSDGCERSLHTNSDCASCNAACSPAHGAGSCSTGSCVVTSCDSGFDNCNGNAADGCEASLTAASSCGACGKKCAAGLICSNGQCACMKDADCGGGTQKCCGGACTDAGGACFPFPCIPGTNRTNNANCGGCGQVCWFCCSTP